MDSESSQSSSTSQTDNRRVIGEAGVSAENSTVNYTYTYRPLDADVANSAFKYGNAAGAAALSFGSDALGFGSEALASNNKAGAAALSFGSDALGFGSEALKSNNATTSKALDFGADALAGSWDFGKAAMRNASDTMSDAFGFAQTAMQRATTFADSGADRAADLLVRNSNLVKDAYADAKGRGAMTDKIMIAAVVVAGLVGLAAVWKK